ncbi:MAG: hypothetical protein K2X86_15080 [Cytophagaceae bacterium]|nr:hypothetical protein [Cytophagaceae bacterium]
MRKYFYIATLLFITACAGFQNASLTEDKPLAQLDSAEMNAASPSVLNVEGGVFQHAKSDVGKWDASHGNVIMGKSGTSLTINLKDVGVDWEQASLKFQPLDFSKAPHLIIKARVDVNSKDSLKVRVDLIDEDGLSTNYSPQERYIRAREDFKEYKFSFGGNWVQNWPFKADVNSKKISEIRINFNGGGPNYTGKIYIDEIRASDGMKVITNPNNYVFEDFSTGAAGWWWNKIELAGAEIDKKDVLKLKLENAGPGWESFGKQFDQPVDFSKTPVLKIRMKADQAGKLRVDLHDTKEYSTNGKPAIAEFSASNDYVDLYFDFSDKFFQTWPNNQTVDATKIKDFAFFVNPPQSNSPAYTGNILIDDISLLSLEEYTRLKN